MVAVLDEIIMDEHGESIGTRELINEIRLEHDQEQCVMREVIRLFDGRLVIDRVLHASTIHPEEM